MNTYNLKNKKERNSLLKVLKVGCFFAFLTNLNFKLHASKYFLFPQCELYHWIDVLDRFDEILGTVAKPLHGHQWIFQFDMLKDLHGSLKGVGSI